MRPILRSPLFSDVSATLGPSGSTPALPFISTWTTVSAPQDIILPLVSNGTYSFNVDWGDGSSDEITAWNQTEKTHSYSSTGTYTVTITGTCVGWKFNNSGSKTLITGVSQWGVLDISTSHAFHGCTNLNVTATDAPTVSSTTMQYAFRDCTSLTTPNLNLWDMSGVTSMVGMFQSATSFNGSVDGWDTSSVATTQNMFIHAAAFNQAIGVWDMSSNAHVGGMFYNVGAAAFDQDVGGWNIGQVANAANFMGGNSMSTANYSALLIGWEGQPHQSSVVFTGGGSTYSAGAAATARAALVTDGWTITDGGAA